MTVALPSMICEPPQPAAHALQLLSGMASINKFDAAGISVPPHHVTVFCRFETIEWQVKLESNNVKRGGMKPSPLIVEVYHPAGVDPANAVKVKHCGLIDFNALQGATLNHENFP
jgi:hypothetical protein